MRSAWVASIVLSLEMILPTKALIRSQAWIAREGVVLDRRADVEGNLGRRVEAGMGNLIEDRVVSFVTDAGENGHRRLAKQLCEIYVIQPRQVSHGATAPNDDQGVEWLLLVGCEGLEDGSLDRR